MNPTPPTDQPKAERRHEARGKSLYFGETPMAECYEACTAQRLAERLNEGDANKARLQWLTAHKCIIAHKEGSPMFNSTGHSLIGCIDAEISKAATVCAKGE